MTQTEADKYVSNIDWWHNTLGTAGNMTSAGYALYKAGQNIASGFAQRNPALLVTGLGLGAAYTTGQNAWDGYWRELRSKKIDEGNSQNYSFRKFQDTTKVEE